MNSRTTISIRNSRTTISIRPETKAKLDDLGKKNENYDSLITRLVECKNSVNNVVDSSGFLKKGNTTSAQHPEVKN